MMLRWRTLSRRLWTISCCLIGAGCTATAVADLPPNVTVTPVSAIQGSGNVSPLLGESVSVRGTVSGDFQDGDDDTENNLNGFFIQAHKPDDDPATSDGVFVFEGGASIVDVNVGDDVVVQGQVSEFFGETQIAVSSVSKLGRAELRPLDISLPLPAAANSDGIRIADLERYEGMLVRLTQTLTVADLYFLERYGEVLLAANGRKYAFTNQNAPSVSGYADSREAMASHTLILDDGQSAPFARPIRFLHPQPDSAPDYALRVGDTVSGLTGNIRFSRASGSNGIEAYRLLPSAAPAFVARNPRPKTPPKVAGELRVASFNVLNFFTTLDRGRRICGANANLGCRGADSAEEFDRQRQKIVNSLMLMDADIVGLIELENNDDAAIRNIVDGLNARLGDAHWSFVDTGTIGGDAIRVGLIYNSRTVAPNGNFAVLDSTVDTRFVDDRNRPVLLQAFRQLANDEIFGVAVAHLKSKGSSCDSIGDPDLNDGQGNCNVTRREAAAAIVDWLNRDPGNSGDPDVLLIGDLNAHLLEDPLTTLEDGGLVNLLGAAAAESVYSYQFRGTSGALDHALASPALRSQIVGISEWHINADEAPVLDYNLESGRDAGLFDAASAARASDHDPLMIGLTLAGAGAQKRP